MQAWEQILSRCKGRGPAASVTNVGKTLMRQVMLWIIRGYQKVISPLLPPSCRFVPSCSQYGYEAIATFGPLRGGYMAVRRILRCNPFYPGGYDPVPRPHEESTDADEPDSVST